MYYFTYGQNIAAVESAEQAAKYAAAGWRVVSRETFMDAWKRRDAQDLARMWAEAMPVMVTAPIKIKNWMPAGYHRFHV